MLEKLKRNLEELCQVKPTDRLVVGVSGGPDSLALLLSLRDAGLDVVATHVNHQLRSEADEEEIGVKQLAEQWNIPFTSIKVDVKTYAAHHSMSIEEAARVVRYRFLFEKALAWEASAVAVAHTADDQVETSLMHLLRGSGLSGLAGMKWRSLPNEWSQQIPLVRPLLSTWRVEVMDYLRQKDVQPYWDQSNFDVRYLRNRIRYELVPYLEKFNPAIRRSIWQTCDIVQADEELLDTLTDEACEKVIQERGDGYVGINVEEFCKLSLALKRRVVRHLWKFVSPDSDDLEYRQVNRILENFEKGWVGLSFITENCCLSHEFGKFYLCDPKKLPKHQLYQLGKEGIIEILIPGKTQIAEGLFLIAEIINKANAGVTEMIQSAGGNHAWLDFGRCAGHVYVRKFKPGDRFAPLHSGGHHTKVSDVFINRKIPKRYRENYPLVCDRERIIWIPGYTISHDVRVDANTIEVLHLHLEQM